MTRNFNTYIENPAVDYLRELCLREGTLRCYERGEAFFSAGSVARYFGYIKSGTLKYVAYGDDGTEHVLGLEFAGAALADRLESDPGFREIVMRGTEAVFSTVYDRYVDLHCKTAQQRYNDLISRYPDLFSLFPLKDIASFLNITPTHLSRLRKNI